MKCCVMEGRVLLHNCYRCTCVRCLRYGGWISDRWGAECGAGSLMKWGKLSSVSCLGRCCVGV
jgi:hypothetical protein